MSSFLLNDSDKISSGSKFILDISCRLSLSLIHSANYDLVSL